MRPNYITILIIILCIISNACHNSNIIPQLRLADSLMGNHSDSALIILEKLSIKKMPNKSAKAMYALLLTEALDKNLSSHHSDSLILIATNYYKDNNDNNLKTKAYYYLGRVYQDNEEYVKATEAYLSALKTVSPNQTLLLQIYNNLASCYESQEFYLQAIKTYKESYSAAIRIKDKYGILHATRGLGSIYAIQDEEEKALSYYQKSLSIAQSIKDSLWENALFCDIAKVYDSQGMHIEAKKQIELALKYAPSNINLSPTYFWKGTIFYNLEETDSAIYYFSRASINADIYTKASIYQTLYEICKERKNLEQAISYNDTAIIYYDSIQNIIHHTEISKLIKNHSTEIYEQQIKKQSQKTKLILFIGVLITVFLFIGTLMYISNHNKRTYIHWQQLLIKNQAEKALLKEEIQTLASSKTDDKSNKIKDYSSVVATMKKELSTKNEQLQNLVTKLLGKQAGKYTKLADLFKDIQADPATIEQAQKDIADDGYWGVEQTSDRLVSMAQALSGGDTSKADTPTR